MTEDEAVRELGRDGVRTYSVPMQDVDRAVVDRTPSGFLKLLCDPKGNILGAHALCAGASTLIEQLVLARRKKVRIGALARLVSPYPSLADSIQKAASLYYQELSASRTGWLARRLASWSQ
jgi:pyruvate/2-oxoglutarate dehydrogenase complex dihydrolipoamide dehydrogenase (E3) component